MLRKINTTVQSNFGSLPFVKVIKQLGKLSFFIISENIHAQNINNSRGISVSKSVRINECIFIYDSSHL
jgi:hypothetical protein